MDTPNEQGAEGQQAGNAPLATSSTDMTISSIAQSTLDAGSSSLDGQPGTSAGEPVGFTDADVGNVVASPVVEPSASDTSSSVLPASPAPVTGATAAQEHPAHSAITRLERLIERVSSDFLKEGQTLIAAARAEIDKLI